MWPGGPSVLLASCRHTCRTVWNTSKVRSFKIYDSVQGHGSLKSVTKQTSRNASGKNMLYYAYLIAQLVSREETSASSGRTPSDYKRL